MPLRQQLNDINWLRLLSSAATTAAVALGMLVAVAKIWGDTLWVDVTTPDLATFANYNFTTA